MDGREHAAQTPTKACVRYHTPCRGSRNSPLFASPMCKNRPSQKGKTRISFSMQLSFRKFRAGFQSHIHVRVELPSNHAMTVFRKQPEPITIKSPTSTCAWSSPVSCGCRPSRPWPRKRAWRGQRHTRSILGLVPSHHVSKGIDNIPPHP